MTPRKEIPKPLSAPARHSLSPMGASHVVTRVWHLSSYPIALPSRTGRNRALPTALRPPRRSARTSDAVSPAPTEDGDGYPGPACLSRFPTHRSQPAPGTAPSRRLPPRPHGRRHLCSGAAQSTLGPKGRRVTGTSRTWPSPGERTAAPFPAPESEGHPPHGARRNRGARERARTKVGRGTRALGGRAQPAGSRSARGEGAALPAGRGGQARARPPGVWSRSHRGWERALRPSGDAVSPALPCLLHPVPKCHIHTVFELLQGR